MWKQEEDGSGPEPDVSWALTVMMIMFRVPKTPNKSQTARHVDKRIYKKMERYKKRCEEDDSRKAPLCIQKWRKFPFLPCLLRCFFLCTSLLGCMPIVGGTVIVRSGNFTSLVSLPDLPAEFGPRLQADGVSGNLVLAEPEDSCELGGQGSKIGNRLPSELATKPFIVLISRSQTREMSCTFDVKIRNAEAIGAVAAIVHDDVPEPLIVMGKRSSSPHPTIPAVFITLESGLLLKKLMETDDIQVLLTPVSDLLWVSLLMSACAGALAVSILAGTFYWIRRPIAVSDGRRLVHRLASRVVMTPEQLRELPIIAFSESCLRNGSMDDLKLACKSKEFEKGGRKTAGETKHVCCICLDSYTFGEKLRILPCAHRFHACCIDQWLMCRRPLCPVCKADARPRKQSSCGDSSSSPSRLAILGRRGRVLAWLRNRWNNSPLRMNAATVYDTFNASSSLNSSATHERYGLISENSAGNYYTYLSTSDNQSLYEAEDFEPREQSLGRTTDAGGSYERQETDFIGGLDTNENNSSEISQQNGNFGVEDDWDLEAATGIRSS